MLCWVQIHRVAQTPSYVQEKKEKSFHRGDVGLRRGSGGSERWTSSGGRGSTRRGRSCSGTESGGTAGGGARGGRRGDKFCALNAALGEGLANRRLHVACSTGEGYINTAAGSRASCDTGSKAVDVSHGQVTTIVVDTALKEVSELGVGVNKVGSVVARAGCRSYSGSS